MPDMQGYAFSPGAQQRIKATQNSGLPTNASEALQVLSMHLPAFLGGSPPVPDALLRPRVGGSSPDLAVQAQTTGVPSAAPPLPSSPASGLAGALAPLTGAAVAPGGAVSVPPPPSTPMPPGVAPFATPTDNGPVAPGGQPPTPNFQFHQPETYRGPGGGGSTTPAAPSSFVGNPMSDLLNAMLGRHDVAY